MKKWLVALAALFCLGTTGFSTIIVEEHFNDLSGGTGLTTNWLAGSLTTGLTYPKVYSEGQALASALTFGNGTKFNGTGYDNSTVWFSALIKNFGFQDTRLLLFGGSISSANGVGFSYAGGSFSAFLANGAGTAVPLADSGQTLLIVGKVVFSSSGAEDLKIWVNPTSFGSEAELNSTALGSSTKSGNASVVFTASSYIYPRASSPTTVFDEIRIATTLVEVCPPASPVLSYIPSVESIKPGEPQVMRVLVQNTGRTATNVTAGLSSVNANFTVLSTNSVPSTISTGETVTNLFTVQALGTLASGNYSNQFVFVTQGSSGSETSAITNQVSVRLLDTAYTLMDKQSFSSALGGSDTATLTVSNTAAFALSYTLTGTTASGGSWLSPTGGTFSLAANSATNITVTADASATPGRGQYAGSLSVHYINNGSSPNPAVFNLDFNVGPKITPLAADAVITDFGGVNNFTNYFEPGEVLQITITSTNDGAIAVSNIVNTLTSPSGWTVVPNQAVYPVMAVGDSTSTTYTVTIPANAPDGIETLTARNSADGFSWDGTIEIPVYYQAEPSVWPTNMVINVAQGGTASDVISLTNAGNKAVSYILTDNGPWDVYYDSKTEPALMQHFVENSPGELDLNTTFVNWDTNTMANASLSIGFEFPFFGTVYTNLTVSRYGAIGLDGAPGANTTGLLPSGTGPVIAPFWGDTLFATNSIRFKKTGDKLVISWGNGTAAEVQAWLYPNGDIRVLHGNVTWTDQAVGLQKDGTVFQQTDSIDPEGSNGSSLLWSPASNPWVTFDPAAGTVADFSGSDIQVDVDAAGQSAGTETFTATLAWDDGSTDTVEISIVIEAIVPGIEVLTSPINFSGPAGFISQATMVITNTGNSSLDYVIQNGVGEYTWTNVPFLWDDSHWDEHSSDAVPLLNDGDDKTDWISFGFDFPFYGTLYDSFKIDQNGGIVLNTQRALSNPPDYDTFVACFAGMDVVLDGNARLRYSGDGSKMVVTWENVRQGNSAIDQTFQLILYRDGRILCQYKRLDDANVWPTAGIAVADSGSANWARYTAATLVNAATATYTTNYTVVTNGWTYDVPNLETNGTSVVVTYKKTIKNQAIRFEPSTPLIVSADPVKGTLPVGMSADITLSGDARRLTPGGANNVEYNTTFYVLADAPGTVNLSDTNDFRWVKTTNTVSLLNEYYLQTAGGGDAGYAKPISLYVNGVSASEGSVGVLGSGGSSASPVPPLWGWGDADNLGYNTIYVRLEANRPPQGSSASDIITAEMNPDIKKDVPVTFTATGSVEPAFMADSDLDGMSDVEEWTAGTDAFDAGSVFAIAPVLNADGSRTLSWPAATDRFDRTYVVEFSLDLTGGWTELYRGKNVSTYTDRLHNDAPVVFYRVRVE